MFTEIGRDGTELATDDAKARVAFEKVADKIDKQARRFYLLSYCTPARSFGPPPECDPNRAPAFRLDRNVDAADNADDGGDDGDASGSASKAKGKAKGGFRFGKSSTPGGGE